jgi:predicted SAM-dependent methyltransferase
MRLNVGCGGRRLPGYTGVDVTARPAADIVAPAGKIPLRDGSCEEIMAIHLFEHLLPWEAPAVLAEWFRLLRPGGRLVLEMPDLRKCCENVLTILAGGTILAGKHPNQAGMWGLYGDERLEDPYMLHRWGYTFQTIRPLLEAAGFREITEHPTVFHPIGRHVRDFRVEAVR